MKVWLVILAMAYSLMAFGQERVQAKEEYTARLSNILYKMKNEDPIIRCYHLGRLQGLRDELSVEYHQRKARGEMDERLENLARIHNKLAGFIKRKAGDCVPPGD